MPRIAKDKIQPVETQNSALRKELLARLSEVGLEDLPVAESMVRPEVIPSAFYSFNNEVLKIGGLPIGRLVQIQGDQNNGKTTLALHFVAMAQRQFPDKVCGWVDTEYRLDREYAKKQGVDLSRLLYYSTNIAEEAAAYVEKLLKSGACSVVVLDSLANMAANTTFNNDYWKLNGKGERVKAEQPGVLAKIQSNMVYHISKYANDTQTLFIGINQMRSKIGVVYGPTEEPPGAKAWKFMISLDLAVRKIDNIFEGGPEKRNTPIIGAKIAVNVRTNKLAVQAKTDDSNHLNFYTFNPIEKARVNSAYDQAVQKNIISGTAWVSWKAVNVVGEITDTVRLRTQGKTKLLEELMLRPELLEELERDVRLAKEIDLYEPATEIGESLGSDSDVSDEFVD